MDLFIKDMLSNVTAIKIDPISIYIDLYDMLNLDDDIVSLIFNESLII